MAKRFYADQYYRVLLSLDMAVNARTQKEAFNQAIDQLKKELEKDTPTVSALYFVGSREIQE